MLVGTEEEEAVEEEEETVPMGGGGGVVLYKGTHTEQTFSRLGVKEEGPDCV